MRTSPSCVYDPLCQRSQFGGLYMRCQQRWKALGIATRHAAFSRDAVDPSMASGAGEARCVAGHVITMNEAEIQFGVRAQVQSVEWCKKGIIGARFRDRQMKEIDRPPHTGADRIDHLDHDPGILRLDHVFVGGTAVAQMVAQLDRLWDAITDSNQLADRLLPETNRSRLV